MRSTSFLRASATLLVLCFLLDQSLSAETPAWYQQMNKIREVFNPAAPFRDFAKFADYFNGVFLAIGFGIVTISTVRKVTHARAGEESMGWVATMVMTVALMATGPKLGELVFQAGDQIAASSGYSDADAIETCWKALLVIMPSGTPAGDVVDAAGKKPELDKNKPVERQDGSWTKLAWTWMKMAYTEMIDALANIAVAMNAVANSLIIFVLLLLPSAALVVGMVIIELGLCLRELLRQGMNVFLPLMIACLSFGPMRAAATNFIVRYFSVALWPVAWALGNAFSCNILLSVMTWVISVCHEVLRLINRAPYMPVPPLGAPAAGYLAGAAPALPWGLEAVIIVAVIVSTLLILVSALTAPMLLNATLTRGAAFLGEQLKTAGQMVGSVAASSFAPAAAAGGKGTALGSLASSSSQHLSNVADRLAPLAARAGPVGSVASASMSLLGSAAQALGQQAALPAPGDSSGQGSGGSTGPVTPSMQDLAPVGASRIPRPPSPVGGKGVSAEALARGHRKPPAGYENAITI